MNVAEAKANLSRLVAAVEAGDDVYIARAGHTVVRLVPAKASQPRVFDQWPYSLGENARRESAAPLDEAALAEWGLA
ncbi:MAG: type II toxin-antitoxin system prevent-host-death family antitoxin [Propionibacteriaceae bacterium]|jgi:prevent-host-death family protein|nr:type II toxin-antitoxin system prevent-host-death family antitoxin [Propionibacteriaceae bacterium]